MKTDWKTNENHWMMYLLDLYNWRQLDAPTSVGFRSLRWELHSTEYSKNRWLLNMLHDSMLT